MENKYILQNYVESLNSDIEKHYAIEKKYLASPTVKRGLRNEDGTGVIAGVTRIASVQGYTIEDGERVPADGHLYYRGIDVANIVEAHKRENTFGYEEAVYLLLIGSLPTAEQLSSFTEMLAKARTLPDGFRDSEIIRSPSASIMNKLSRCIMAMYNYDPNPDDLSLNNLLRQSIEIIARFPLIAADAYAVKRHYLDGKSLYLHYPKENLSLSENFLRMLRKDKSFTQEEAHLLDLMLILHAEHGGGNNSAFTCRSLSSTGTDTYSAIAGAVNALKGPLHGGANKKVMEMFREIKSNINTDSDSELSGYLDKILDRKACDGAGVIYGLGHAVYTASDPRAVIIKKYALEMCSNDEAKANFELMQRIERMGIEKVMDRRSSWLPICANVDMYSGLVYEMLGIPEDLYTPLFAIARIAGWCAHRIEEIISGSKIYRPAYRAAIKHAPYIPMNER